MGCWNGTCSLTNLPIKWGDEVVVIPLIENMGMPTVGLTYYPTDNYNVLGLPFYGEYNDYGGIEKIEIHPIGLKFFEDNPLYETNKDPKITGDMIKEAFEKSNYPSIKFMMPELHSLISTSELDVTKTFLEEHFYDDTFLAKNEAGKLVETNYMMIHKGLYERLIEEVGTSIPYGEKLPLRTLWENRIKNALKFIERKKKEEEELQELGIDLFMFNREGFAHILGLSSSFVEDNLTINYMMDKLYENPEDNELLSLIVDTILFRNALASLRKGYLATSGAGSQNEDMYLHKILAEFILVHTDGYVEKYKNANEGDEEALSLSEKEILMESRYWSKDTDKNLEK